MIRTNYVLSFLVVCCLVACNTKSFKTKKELMSFISDESNGLLKEVEWNGVSSVVYYKPTDVMVKETVGNETDSSSVKKWRMHYEQYCYFVLSISNNGHDALYAGSVNQQQFNENIQSLAFHVSDWLTCVTSTGDSIPIIDYYFPRMHGLTGTCQILVVYPRKRLLSGDWVKFKMKEFGLHTGNQKFTFETKKLKNEPILIF